MKQAMDLSKGVKQSVYRQPLEVRTLERIGRQINICETTETGFSLISPQAKRKNKASVHVRWLYDAVVAVIHNPFSRGGKTGGARYRSGTVSLGKIPCRRCDRQG